MVLLLLTITTTRAAFLSLLVPGAGDIALGNKDRGIKFIVAEGLIWAGYGVYTYLGSDIRKEYLNFAVIKAGANPGRNDETYLDAMEWYKSIDDYNTYIRQLARQMYPDTTDTTVLNMRRDFINSHSISDEYSWQWYSEDDFRKYILLRKRSRHYLGTATTIASLAIVNRLVSFIMTTYVSENVSLNISPKGVKFTWRF